MKSRSVLLAISGILLFSCSENTSEVADTTNTQTELIDPSTISTDAVAEVNIKGMTCEMGCGSLIRKKLYETGAVSECDFDFKDTRKVNSAKISFNSKAISATEIEKLISNIEEGEFSASLKKECASKKECSETTKCNKSKETALIEVSENSFSIPSVSQIIRTFLF